MLTEPVHSYGYHFEDAMTDPFVLVNKAASETTSAATVPGTFLVDTFPMRESLLIRSCIQLIISRSQICAGVDARCWIQEDSS